MSEENVELAERGYAALNAAYKSGSAEDLRPFAARAWDPEIVMRTEGVFPESGEARGHEGMLRFIANQMEAFTEMWLEPREYIDAGDKIVVPYRFGGQARHSGIEVEWSFVHVWTMRNGKATRLDVFQSEAAARDAAGLPDQ